MRVPTTAEAGALPASEVVANFGNVSRKSPVSIPDCSANIARSTGARTALPAASSSSQRSRSLSGNARASSSRLDNTFHCSEVNRIRPLSLEPILRSFLWLGGYYTSARASASAPSRSPESRYRGETRSGQRGEQEQPRLLPVAPNRALGNAEGSGDFRFSEAGEIAHLDHAHEALVDALQIRQRIVEPKHLAFGRLDGFDHVGRQRQMQCIGPTPCRAPFPY